MANDYSVLGTSNPTSMARLMPTTAQPMVGETPIVVMPRSAMGGTDLMPTFLPMDMGNLPVSTGKFASPRSSLATLPTAEGSPSVTGDGGGMATLLASVVGAKNQTKSQKASVDGEGSSDLLATIRELKEEVLAEQKAKSSAKGGKISKSNTTKNPEKLISRTPMPSALEA